MIALKLNTSVKHHAYVALFISVWLVLFLVLIAPFDVSDLPFGIRLQILPPYGIISFVCYMLLIPLQNWIYQQTQKWTVVHEVIFFTVFHVLTLFGCFLYYKTDIIRGTYPFNEFVLQIFYPIFFILFVLILIARWYVNNKILRDEIKKVSIVGDNKLDVLHIYFSDLVCMTSADNYVEVFYIENGQLQKKLLRSTLKKMETQWSALMKVHRSYLINPEHFSHWIDSKSIALTQMNVPISNSYKENIIALKIRP